MVRLNLFGLSVGMESLVGLVVWAHCVVVIFHRIQCKWHFRNKVSEKFSEIPSFRPKSVWKPSKGHVNLKVFLGQLDKEPF